MSWSFTVIGSSGRDVRASAREHFKSQATDLDQAVKEAVVDAIGKAVEAFPSHPLAQYSVNTNGHIDGRGSGHWSLTVNAAMQEPAAAPAPTSRGTGPVPAGESPA